MAKQFQGFQGQNPPDEQGNLQWGKNQMPYRQNPYQLGWAPLVGPPYQPQMSFNTQLLFLATLELPNVSRLMNDPIFRLPYWPPVPSKISSDCPKFEGKEKEDP